MNETVCSASLKESRATSLINSIRFYIKSFFSQVEELENSFYGLLGQLVPILAAAGYNIHTCSNRLILFTPL